MEHQQHCSVSSRNHEATLIALTTLQNPSPWHLHHDEDPKMRASPSNLTSQRTPQSITDFAPVGPDTRAVLCHSVSLSSNHPSMAQHQEQFSSVSLRSASVNCTTDAPNAGASRALKFSDTSLRDRQKNSDESSAVQRRKRPEQSAEQSGPSVDETQQGLLCSLSTTKRRKKSVARTFEPSNLLRMIPHDVLDYAISFLCPQADRSATSRTCHSLRSSMVHREMMRSTKLLGNAVNDCGCFIQRQDTKESILCRLRPFLEAQNCDALFMAGMIQTYCCINTEEGIALLQQAAALKHVESMFSLAVILRDSDVNHSKTLFRDAHVLGYLPASLEVLSNEETRENLGYSIEELMFYTCSKPLTVLLRKCFSELSGSLRSTSSQCWNPRCGRWAHKLVKKEARHEKVQFARMKMCSSCRKAKYCSKFCHVHDWRSGRHRQECEHLR